MGLLAWIVFGALAGGVASRITGRRQGCCLNIVVGVVGAFIGGIIVQLATGRGFSLGFNLPSFAVAILGAVILLAIAGLATRPLRL
ncbi:MAG: GlsB/YeaQ/YmgE family stress response membrane protein [Candidatus Eisenbacteria bacterium]